MKLLKELESLRGAGGSVGPDHPRFRKWLTEARLHLERSREDGRLREFQRLSFSRQGSGSRRGELPDPKETREFLADLARAAELLEQSETEHGVPLSESALSTGAAGDGQRPLPSGSVVPTGASAAAPPPGKQVREPMTIVAEAKHNSNLRAQYFSSTTRSQAIEGLMIRLDKEMRSEAGNWEKIQELMEEMASLKRCDDLLARLDTALTRPDARWDTVRDLLGQLWSVRKSMVFDLLPTLLGA